MRSALGAVESIFILALRAGLAYLFALAAWAKLSDPQEFAFSVKAFKILPDHLAVLATFAVPWTEGLCAVLLLIGLWTRAAALVLAVAVLAFIAGIVSVLQRGLSVTCGCFGDYHFLCPADTVGWCNIGQNALLLAASLYILVRGPGLIAIDRLIDRA